MSRYRPRPYPRVRAEPSHVITVWVDKEEWLRRLAAGAKSGGFRPQFDISPAAGSDLLRPCEFIPKTKRPPYKADRRAEAGR